MSLNGRSMRLEQLGPEEVRSRIKRGADTVLVPLGSLERHGNPFTPIGLDGIIGEVVVERAAHAAEVLRTPLVPFGYTPMHVGRVADGCGAVTIRAETYRCLLEDIGRSLIYQGFDKIVFASMHGPNVDVSEEILYSLRDRTGAFVAMYGGRQSSAIEEIFDAPPPRLTSDVEASMAMAIVGERFQSDEYLSRSYDITAPDWLGSEFSKSSGTGSAVTYDGATNIVLGIDDFEYTRRSAEPPPPTHASAERGEALLDSLSGHLAGFLEHVKALDVDVRDREFPERAR